SVCELEELVKFLKRMEAEEEARPFVYGEDGRSITHSSARPSPQEFADYLIAYIPVGEETKEKKRAACKRRRTKSVSDAPI
ncbi:MAG: hypothetical protein ABIH99_03205, partial [Candidatus Micrarchaeota archaeon]